MKTQWSKSRPAGASELKQAKKVSIVLDPDGRLHIEAYKKGYGVEGIMTGKKQKYKLLKDRAK